MGTKIIIKYVVCNDIVKRLNLKEYLQTKKNIAEVVTTAIISPFQYFGKLGKTCKELKANGYIKDMLNKIRLNRKLHNIHTTNLDFS